MNRPSQWLFEVPTAFEISENNPEWGNGEWEVLVKPISARRSAPQPFQPQRTRSIAARRFQPIEQIPSSPGKPPMHRTVYGWGQYRRRVEELPPDQRAILAEVGNEIKKSFQPGYKPVRVVQVYGHADWDTPRNPQREQQMSQERALTVANWLKSYIKSHIAAYIVWDIQGFGATQLITSPTSEANRSRNRRVEMFLQLSIPMPLEPCDASAQCIPKPGRLSLIELALCDSKKTLCLARDALIALLENNPGMNTQVRRRTLEALQVRLKVSPSDSHFRPSIAQAIVLINRNLATQRQFQHLVREDEPFCQTDGRNAWGLSFIGEPTQGIRLCNRWFQSCRECRRDVITHEFFHLIGLKGEGGALNTSGALDDANEMAQLVSHIATGLADACAKWSCSWPCNQPTPNGQPCRNR